MAHGAHMITLRPQRPGDDTSLTTTLHPAICHCLFAQNSATTKMRNCQLLPMGAGTRGLGLAGEPSTGGKAATPTLRGEAGGRGTSAKAHARHKSKLVRANHGEAQPGNENCQEELGYKTALRWSVKWRKTAWFSEGV